MIKSWNKLFFIVFFLFNSILQSDSAQLRKQYLYKIEPTNPLYDKFFRGDNFKGFNKNIIKHFLLTIHGDQEKLKDDDIIHIIFEGKEKHLNVGELGFKISSKETWVPRLKSSIRNDRGQFGDPIYKYIMLDEKHILTDPDITLDLTYYSQENRVQVHGDQEPEVSSLLKKNEKDILDQPKYIRSKMSLTKDYYSKESVETLDAQLDKVNLFDIDQNGKKAVLRNNLDPNRFFYMSEDSLYPQLVDVKNLQNDKRTRYDVWQTKKANKIPTKLQENGISHGDMKSLEITSHVNPEVPDKKELSYRSIANLRLSKNIYEFRKEKKLSRATYFRFKNKQRKNDSWALVDKKHDDKFVYLLDSEYKFEKNEDDEDVLVPIEDGGKTTVKTLGDIRSIWVPVITSIVVFAGFIN